MEYNLEFSCKCFDEKMKKYLVRKFNQYNRFKKRKYFYEKDIESPYFDIGIFSKARAIGYAFAKCVCRKKMVHWLYHNRNFYPKSILINKSEMGKKKFVNRVKKFMNNENAVMKKSLSTEGNDVFLVKSVDDIIKNIGDTVYVLQKEIDPALYNGKKFDFRIYLVYIKEDERYNVYSVPNGFVRICPLPFVKNDPDCFLTNVNQMPENTVKRDHVIFYRDFLKMYCEQIGKDAYELEEEIYTVVQNIAIKHLNFIQSQNIKFFEDKKIEPKCQFWVLGLDIILDKDNKPYLLELNGEPGLPRETKGHNYKMLYRVWKNAIFPWIQGRTHTCDEDPYFYDIYENLDYQTNYINNPCDDIPSTYRSSSNRYQPRFGENTTTNFGENTDTNFGENTDTNFGESTYTNFGESTETNFGENGEMTFNQISKRINFNPLPKIEEFEERKPKVEVKRPVTPPPKPKFEVKRPVTPPPKPKVDVKVSKPKVEPKLEHNIKEKLIQNLYKDLNSKKYLDVKKSYEEYKNKHSNIDRIQEILLRNQNK